MMRREGITILLATLVVGAGLGCSGDDGGTDGPGRSDTGSAGADTSASDVDGSDTTAADTGTADTGQPDVPVDCPTPVAGCRVTDAESSALTDWILMDIGPSVACSGLQSFPPGHIATYEWTFTSVPAGSGLAGTLSEGPSSEVEFTPDAAGRFELALEVVDDEGVRSCAPDTVEINVEGIASVMPPMTVTLAWQQFDADFDLHLVRDGAELFSTPGDCHKDNLEPDWGTEGSLHDPRLTGDSIGEEPVGTDEIAPEVIGIFEVEAGVPYTGHVVLTSIGSEDHPATEAEATVTVRVRGETVGTYAETLVAADQWEAFTITFDETGGYAIDPSEGSGE